MKLGKVLEDLDRRIRQFCGCAHFWLFRVKTPLKWLGGYTRLAEAEMNDFRNNFRGFIKVNKTQ